MGQKFGQGTAVVVCLWSVMSWASAGGWDHLEAFSYLDWVDSRPGLSWNWWPKHVHVACLCDSGFLIAWQLGSKRKHLRGVSRKGVFLENWWIPCGLAFPSLRSHAASLPLHSMGCKQITKATRCKRREMGSEPISWGQGGSHITAECAG